VGQHLFIVHKMWHFTSQ